MKELYYNTSSKTENILLGYEQTKFNDLVQATKSAKYKWVSHVFRLNDNIWTKK